MNVRTLIPPLIALVVAGVWLGSQRSSIRRLKVETVVLRERVEVARMGLGAGGGQSLAGRMKEQKGTDEGEIDWKDLGSKMVESESGDISGIRSMMELQTTLMGLSGEELLAEIEKIKTLDLSRDVRKALDGTLVGMLAKKDPQAALDRYLDRANEQENGMSWQLSSAFQQWQKRDPAAAMAWFDAEIAKGSFDSKTLDGRSDSRLRFEATAISSLLSDDPSDARRRIEALPEDQRKQVFNMGMFSGLKEDSHMAFADLVREVVPEDERGDAYNSAVSGLARNGFDKVDGFIFNIEATASEKDAIVSRAVETRIQNIGWEREIDRSVVDEVRTWAASQSPEHADAITGKSLANVWGEKSSYEDRARMIEDLHSEGAEDALIIAFLSEGNGGLKSTEISRSLAGLIRDEPEREKLLGSMDGGSKPPSSSGVAAEAINQE